MAQPWVPGPAPVYWSGIELAGGAVPGRSRDVRFLGYTQQGVDLLMDPQYAPVVTDAGGRVPTDLIFQGFSATVSLILTRWNEVAYAELADHANRGGQLTRGHLPSGRIGTVMCLEGAAVVLYVLFPYAANLAYASMPRGYRLLNCVPDREGLPERGSKPAKLLLTFRCLPSLIAHDVRNGHTTYPAREGEQLYQLYDADLGELALPFPD